MKPKPQWLCSLDLKAIPLPVKANSLPASIPFLTKSYLSSLPLVTLFPVLEHVCVLSHGRLSATPWTVPSQAPLSMGFPRQEYWSGLPLPFPGYLPDPGIESVSPLLAGGFFITEPPRKPQILSVPKLGTLPVFQSPGQVPSYPIPSPYHLLPLFPESTQPQSVLVTTANLCSPCTASTPLILSPWILKPILILWFSLYRLKHLGSEGLKKCFGGPTPGNWKSWLQTWSLALHFNTHSSCWFVLALLLDWVLQIQWAHEQDTVELDIKQLTEFW